MGTDMDYKPLPLQLQLSSFVVLRLESVGPPSPNDPARQAM